MSENNWAALKNKKKTPPARFFLKNFWGGAWATLRKVQRPRPPLRLFPPTPPHVFIPSPDQFGAPRLLWVTTPSYIRFNIMILCDLIIIYNIYSICVNFIDLRHMCFIEYLQHYYVSTVGSSL